MVARGAEGGWRFQVVGNRFLRNGSCMSPRKPGLLVRAEKGMRGNSPAWIAKGLRNAFPTWRQGDICKLLGVHNNRFALLRGRNKAVSFEFLCRISFVLGISVVTLLTHDPDTWTIGTLRGGGWMPAQRVLVEKESEALSIKLRHLLDEGCSSLRSASIRLRRSRMTLLRHFPVECRELLKRSRGRYVWRTPKH